MSITWSVEVETAVSVPRMFKAGVMDWHNLAPKLAPEKILSGAYVVGTPGEVGSIRQFNFAPGAPSSLLKERLDYLDDANYEIKCTLVEGGSLGIHIESCTSDVRVEPKAGGSMVKITNTYKPLPGVNIEEVIEKAKARINEAFKGCEAYLVANPDAYN